MKGDPCNKDVYFLSYALKKCFDVAPVSVIVYISLNILNGFFPLLMVYVIAEFIDSMISLLSQSPNYRHMIVSAVIIFVYYAYNQFSEIIGNYCKFSIENQLNVKLKPEITKKIATFPYTAMEDKNTYDLAAMINDRLGQVFPGILADGTSLLYILINMLGILSILFFQTWWLVLLFVLIILPLICLSFKGGSKIYEIDMKSTMLSRIIMYLSDVLLNRESSGERVLFQYSDSVNQEFRKKHLERSNITTEAIARLLLKSKIYLMIMGVFLIVCMGVMYNAVITHQMTSGLYIAVIGAIVTLVRTSAPMLADISMRLSEHARYMKDYLQLMAIEGDDSSLVYDKRACDFDLIEIKNLSFKFAGTDKYILKNINMQFKKGYSYALIGLNGAGKTTLTRILTGLYENYEGNILIDGKDMRSFDKNELRSLFGIVYQDFAKYYLSLKDNITGFTGQPIDDALLEVLELKKLIHTAPLGLETPVGKIEDHSVEISGGEWQKVAIARALHQRCPFVILDEPTASLSPMTESKLYKHFSNISSGSTTLLISHRLGSTKISDYLYVLDQGTIIEQGSHDMLMEQNGLYASMFCSQKGWYENEEVDIS